MEFTETQLKALRAIQKKAKLYRLGTITAYELAEWVASHLAWGDDLALVGPALATLPAPTRPDLLHAVASLEEGKWFRGSLGLPVVGHVATPEENRRHAEQCAEVEARLAASVRRLGPAVRAYYAEVDAGHDARTAYQVPAAPDQPLLCTPQDRAFWDHLRADIARNGLANWDGSRFARQRGENSTAPPVVIPTGDALRRAAAAIFEAIEGTPPPEHWT